MPRFAHTLSCRKCKHVFALLLKGAVGDVREQHRLGLPTGLKDLLEEFRGSLLDGVLSTIHNALQQHRGFENFVGNARLRGVDYFLPEYSIAVEFDEAQHFTVPRGLTLKLYPADIRLGFDRKRWLDLCEDLNRRDNSPPYRDEQRAWLDVLRDFSAVLLEHRPTVRIFAGDERWCALDPARAETVQAFARRYLPGVAVEKGACDA
jgi:hypothetical protein